LSLCSFHSYPQRGPALADVYIHALAAELENYPPDILRETVSIARRTLRFLPSIAEIIEIADRLMGERQRMLKNITALEREHALREEQRQSESVASASGRSETPNSVTSSRQSLARRGSASSFLPRRRCASGGQANWRADGNPPTHGKQRSCAARLGRSRSVASVCWRKQACANPIGRSARMAILSTAMTDEWQARDMLKAAIASTDLTDEHCGRIVISTEVESLVTDLLDRERIEGARNAAGEAA